MFVWQLNINVFIAYDITGSHKNKATSFKVKGRCIWESFLFKWLQSWIPIQQDGSLCGGPAALLHPATEQVEHTGSCCTELWRLQISSVTDLQELALTFKRTTPMFFYYYYYYFSFTLWKNKHLNKLWPIYAVLIESWTPIQRDAVMPVRWHVWQHL